MPSKTRRSSRRFRRGKREVLWASIVFENVSAAVAPGTNSALVLPSDWVRNTGGGAFQKGCVLERVRGWIDVHATGVAVTDSVGTVAESVYFALWKSEEEEDFAGNDWSASAVYNDEDLLWTGGVGWSGSTNLPAAGVQLQQPRHKTLEIDVKAKRKLDSDTQIVFTAQSGAVTPQAVYSGVLRALLTLP